MASGTADIEAPASPYGRYMRSRLARLGFTVGPALLVATTAWNAASPVPGVRTTAWDLSALVFSCFVFVGIQLSIWLVPLTVIDERGIRRTLSRPRRTVWDEVQDFSVEGYGPPGSLCISAIGGEFGCTASQRMWCRGYAVSSVPATVIRLRATPQPAGCSSLR